MQSSKSNQERRSLPSFFFGGQTVCTYCGDYADTRDHIVPVDYSAVTRVGYHGPRTYACRSCNSALGSKYFETFWDRCVAASKTLDRRSAPVLWSQKQIKTLDYSLQRHVQYNRDHSLWLRSRADWFESRDFLLNIEQLPWQPCFDTFSPKYHEQLHSYFATTLLRIRELYHSKLFSSNP